MKLEFSPAVILMPATELKKKNKQNKKTNTKKQREGGKEG